ncbi:alpha/beta fold hydrolase [Salinisphaera sp. Q1T1-3]|uniref:alpha/beta fold hydrolase n=1 Tax=Salinisphaera sp. Q1T1-3 TaxID=2321229 RepID=UPI000E72AB58|nr:alpha/beta fold hydrolase [Salinisphaera sp. Q1T1-3]RJS94387.1 alpha/beta fold hydrolase [Salinisphaera sp. Q1T1-3]
MSETTPPRRKLPPELSVLRRRTRMQIEWLDIDGVQLRCGIRRGRGRPIVLLNTLGANLDMMLPLVNALDDSELIVPELPGAGQTPSLRLPRTMGWHARLLATLLDRLGYDGPLNFVGLAWGGALVQTFALAYPARTNRIVLASSSVGVLGRTFGTNGWRRLQAVRRYRKAEAPSPGLAGLYGGLIRQRPELLRPRGEHASGPSTRGYLHQALAGAAWTSVHRLHNLGCPTLIMGGDDDPISPLVNSRFLYWLIPKSHLHVVRGGGHLFLLLRANESAAVILRFINERRYDGTDNADYHLARGLPRDGQLVPPAPGDGDAPLAWPEAPEP